VRIPTRPPKRALDKTPRFIQMISNHRGRRPRHLHVALLIEAFQRSLEHMARARQTSGRSRWV
jgi:hypothetical protein